MTVFLQQVLLTLTNLLAVLTAETSGISKALQCRVLLWKSALPCLRG